MTIRFAGAHAGGRSPLRAWRCLSVPLCAANDNIADRTDQTVLVAALHHFVRHGLAAAERAAAFAIEARDAGDDGQCRHWLAVCRQLDRRMADRVGQGLFSARA